MKVMYYNKDLFDAANLKYPDDDWTFDDFFNYAKKLTVDEDMDGLIDQYGCLISPKIYPLCPWLWSNDGRFINDDKTRCMINTPNNIATLTFLRDLSLKYHYSVRPSEMVNQDYFQMGKLAMVSGWPGNIQRYRPIREFSWDIVALPSGSNGCVTQISSTMLSITSKTSHAPEAWRLVKYLISEEVGQKLVKTGRGIPINKSILFSDSFLEDTPPDNREVFRKVLNNSRLGPLTQNLNEIEQAANDELILMWLGEKSIEDGCRDMEKKVNAILARTD
jgi:multiple sugar transport system substrate-binding protein